MILLLRSEFYGMAVASFHFAARKEAHRGVEDIPLNLVFRRSNSNCSKLVSVFLMW